MGKQMGWSKIGYANDTVLKLRAWNPGGFGCTGCPLKGKGCWAEGMSKRLGKTVCEKCRAFVPHLHPERLDQPANTKTPAVVLVQYTGDLFDVARAPEEWVRFQAHMIDAPQHTYVLLTKQAERAAFQWPTHPPSSWHLGLSICNQEQADAKLPTFLGIQGKLWLSLEPLWGAVRIWDCGGWGKKAAEWWGKTNRIEGVIVGQDNRPGAPGTDTLDHVRSVVKQCKAAGVPVFVKQLHLWKCRCGKAYEHRPSVAGGKGTCSVCMANMPRTRKLCHDPADFPEDLRRRDLPWSMPHT